MTSPGAQPALIAEQLRRAFEGNAWHGPALLELLEDVDAVTAAAKPLPDVHSMWELVLHVAVWDAVACRRLAGEKCQPEGLANFPVAPKPTEAGWGKVAAHAKRPHVVFVKTVEALPESPLRGRFPGKRYFFSHMLQGGAHHDLYPAGQFPIIKKPPLRG